MTNRALHSSFLLALALVALLGLCLRVWQPLRTMCCNYCSWDENPLRYKLAVLADSKRVPNFILLGSSLAMSANALADARWQKCKRPQIGIEYDTHADTVYLDYQLSKLLHTKVFGADLSCQACMVSDALAILKQVYTMKRSAPIVIYCVAPRDFVDLRTPRRYDVFKLAPSISIDQLWAHGFEASVDRVWGDIFHLYRVRRDYQSVGADVAQLICCPSRYRSIRPIFHLMDLRVTAGRLKRDLRVYEEVYRSAKPENTFEQWQSLHQLCSLCTEHGATLYVVNMPVTKENKQLMPGATYDQFRSGLADACAKGDARFIDLDHSLVLTLRDFRDSVHLNGAGGIKAFEQLAQQIAALQEQSTANSTNLPQLSL